MVYGMMPWYDLGGPVYQQLGSLLLLSRAAAVYTIFIGLLYLFLAQVLLTDRMHAWRIRVKIEVLRMLRWEVAPCFNLFSFSRLHVLGALLLPRPKPHV